MKDPTWGYRTLLVMFCVNLNIILWTLMECLHLFKAAKFGSLKMHVLCKVGKNIIFQNKTFLVMFYQGSGSTMDHGSTDKIKHFGTNFVILNIFWKQKIVKTVWPVRDTASQWSLLSLYLSWVTVGTRMLQCHVHDVAVNVKQCVKAKASNITFVH